MTNHEYMSERCRAYRQIPRLSVAEERELVRLWQDQRDEPARRRLIEANMRHVEAIARKYRGRSVCEEDLVAEGCLGLLMAIDRFDSDKGVRLVTYASYWIRAYVLKAVNLEWKRGKTGLGRLRWTAFFRARRTRDAHVTRYGKDGVRIEEMAGELHMDVDQLRDLLDRPEIHDLSLDFTSPTGEGRGREMHEVLRSPRMGPEAATSRRESLRMVSETVENVLAGMGERDRLIARERLMRDEPVTLRVLGERLGLSRERVRQIEVRIRAKLDEALRPRGESLGLAV
ncbi:MAG: sigma-70 family RNA polymerase sigma factor [Deltaproteobacteria bacterium]|nr:sigma-70 family RNA polymerase sigma factor [Deltaproteobacteria bacterium]